MPLELLKAIVNKPLPLTITDPNDVDKLRLLNAAGYITARLPSPQGEQTFAQVLHITAEGRAAVTSRHKRAAALYQVTHK